VRTTRFSGKQANDWKGKYNYHRLSLTSLTSGGTGIKKNLVSNFQGTTTRIQHPLAALDESNL